MLICDEDFIEMEKHEFFFRGPQSTCGSSNDIICDYESQLVVILWLLNMKRVPLLLNVVIKYSYEDTRLDSFRCAQLYHTQRFKKESINRVLPNHQKDDILK